MRQLARTRETKDMRIRGVEAENYRAFKHTQITLPRAGLTFVAGANNAGKSALLSALDVVAGRGEPAAVRHGAATSPARVTATFELEDDERLPLLSDAAESTRLMSRGALSEIVMVFEERSGEAPGLVELRGPWPDHGLVTIAEVYWDGTRGGVRSTTLLQPNTTGDPSSLQDRAGGGPFWLDQFISQWPDLQPLWHSFVKWRAGFYHFRALRTGSQRSAQLMSQDLLDPSGSNLGAVLLHLWTNRQDLFLQLRHLMMEIVPEIGQLEIPTSGQTMEVAFADEYLTAFRHNLKDLGTGVEQLLLTLVLGLTEGPYAPGTVLIEEPETNLHPAAQRALLSVIQQWPSERLTIIATHSPIMIDWASEAGRLWLVRRARGESTVVPVGTDPLPLLNSLGIRLSDVLSADRILIVEGPSDQDVLATWFPELLRNPRVAVIQGRGGDNARHAALLSEWIRSADTYLQRQILYLRDRDELPSDLIDRLESSGVVHVLRRRELENYLLDAGALACVFAQYTSSRAVTTPPAEQDVEAAITAAAEELRHTIIINRVAREFYSPIRLMDHRLRRDLVRKAVDEAAFTRSLLDRLPLESTIRSEIQSRWQQVAMDVEGYEPRDLVNVAPGEEILNAVFLRFLGRRFSKRNDGVAIARAMNGPPADLAAVVEDFLTE